MNDELLAVAEVKKLNLTFEYTYLSKIDNKDNLTMVLIRLTMDDESFRHIYTALLDIS